MNFSSLFAAIITQVVHKLTAHEAWHTLEETYDSNTRFWIQLLKTKF